MKCTKSCCYKHKSQHKPSALQQKYTNKASDKYISNISDYAIFTLCSSLKENPNLHSSSIKTILKTNFPVTKKISSHDIYNTKIKCFSLMKLHNSCNNDFQINFQIVNY